MWCLICILNQNVKWPYKLLESEWSSISRKWRIYSNQSIWVERWNIFERISSGLLIYAHFAYDWHMTQSHTKRTWIRICFTFRTYVSEMTLIFEWFENSFSTIYHPNRFFFVVIQKLCSSVNNHFEGTSLWRRNTFI